MWTGLWYTGYYCLEGKVWRQTLCIVLSGNYTELWSPAKMGAVYEPCCVLPCAASLACAVLDFISLDETDLIISVRKIYSFTSSVLTARPHFAFCRGLVLPHCRFSTENWGQVCLCRTQKEEGFEWPSLNRFHEPMRVMAANYFGWVMESWEMWFAEAHIWLAFSPHWYKRKIIYMRKLQEISSAKTIQVELIWAWYSCHVII